MDIETIRILAETARPPAAKWKFTFAREANVEIHRLENLLGLEQSRPIFNLGQANARIEKLAALLTAKAASASPAAASGAQTASASAVEQCLEEACATGILSGALIAKMSRAERDELSRTSNSEVVRRKIEVAKLKNMLPQAVGATKKCLQAKISALEARLETEPPQRNHEYRD
jgi:hypothetical protein